MLFTKRLREGVRQGRIRCSVRIWAQPHVKVGGRYQMEEGQIVVDSVVSIGRKDITRELALESGFSSVQELLQIAKHGSGDNIYLIRFHYLAPGAWDAQSDRDALDEEGRGDRPQSQSSRSSTLLQRIRASAPPARRPDAEGSTTPAGGVRPGVGRRRGPAEKN